MVLNRRPSFVGLVVLAATLLRCASAPPASTAQSVDAKTFVAPLGKARVYVVRRGVIGTAILFQVSIDGRIAGSLPTRSFLAQDVDPGKHNVSVFAPGNQESVVIAAETGRAYFVHVELSKTSLATKAVVEQVYENEGRKLVSGASMVATATDTSQ